MNRNHIDAQNKQYRKDDNFNQNLTGNVNIN